MKRILWLIAYIIYSTINVHAQNSSVGLKFGGGVDVLWGNSIVRQFSRPLSTGIIGIYTDIKMSDVWSTSLELNYDQHGSQTRIQFDSNDTKTMYRFDYLSMPITVKRYFPQGKSKLRYCISAGGYIAVLNRAKYLFWNNGRQLEDLRVDEDYAVQNYGALLAVGFERTLGSSLVGSFEVRNSVGLNNISKLRLVSGSLRTYSTKFVLGLRFDRSR